MRPVIMKVLIVEDNPGMRHMIRNVVEDLAEVFECGDGSQALSLYEQHRPDWVLMDIRMTGIGGIEATRLITTAHSDAQVVIVTNYDDKRLQESARSAGASSYVLKENLFALRRILTSAAKPV